MNDKWRLSDSVMEGMTFSLSVSIVNFELFFFLCPLDVYYQVSSRPSWLALILEIGCIWVDKKNNLVISVFKIRLALALHIGLATFWRTTNLRRYYGTESK